MRPLLLTLLTLSALPAAAQQPAATDASPQPPPAAAAPAQPAPSRHLEGMGRTPEEEALLKEISAALQAYEDEARDFKREIQLLVERKYEEKRNSLAASYEK